MKLVRTIIKLAVAASLFLMTACGSGLATLAGGVGTGGTGIVLGTIIGFASLVVDGTDYNSATGTYWTGNNQQESAPASSLAVALGQQVRVELDDKGNPVNVQIEPALIGAVGTVGTNTFTINGVTVRVNTDPSLAPKTFYAGLAGFGSISTGQQLEVHGLYGVDGSGKDYILATRIELLPASNSTVRITGAVTGLDTATSTFDLGTVKVQYDANSSILPAGQPLANGAVVNVWSPMVSSGQAMHAQVIRIRTLAGMQGKMTVSGLVAGLKAGGFTVSGIPAVATATGVATIVKGLASGEYVVVAGQVDTATGKLVASDILPSSALPVAVTLKGTITNYVSSGNFQVRGSTIDASSVQLSSGVRLGNGIYVNVQGKLLDNKVVAQSVAVLSSTPDDSTVEYVGTVSQLSGNAFVLTTGGGTSYNVSLSSNIGYEYGNSASLVNGARVEVEATKTANGLDAYGISFLGTSGVGAGELETSGIAYDVTSTSFVVNGLTILINGQSTVGLADGVEVEVHFVDTNGQYLATNISIED